jgi:hypothetical protein
MSTGSCGDAQRRKIANGSAHRPLYRLEWSQRVVGPRSGPDSTGTILFHLRGVMRCMIAGQPFYLQASDVETAMKSLEPEPIRGACVEVAGRWYPVMQVGAAVTGQDRRDFTSADVARALTQLGLSCRTTAPTSS